MDKKKSKEAKMRETLRNECKSPFYRNSRREKNKALKEFNDVLNDVNPKSD